MALTNTPSLMFHEWWRGEYCASDCSSGDFCITHGASPSSWSFSITHGNSLSPTGLLHHLWNISIILLIRIMSLCAWYTYTHTHIQKSIRKKKDFLWVKYFTLKLQRVRGTQDFIKLSHWTLQNQIYLAQAFSGIHDQGVTWKDSCGMEAAKSIHSELLSK